MSAGGVIARSLQPAELAALFAPMVGKPAIGLAVSGGVDSLALMLLAHRWTGLVADPPKLFVYSLDHGLRPEAAAEVFFVTQEAQKLGLAARGLAWTGAKPSTGLSEAARAARYRLIGDAMRADGVDVLLTGHHREDQAETILMRLAHGSGLEGLKGMTAESEVEGVPVFRPLLPLSRPQLELVVRSAGLTPVTDPSNDDVAYERVRWRHTLPELTAMGLDSARLFQFGQRMAEADAALEHSANRAFEEIATLDGFGAAHLDARAFAATPAAIGYRLLARVLGIAGGRQNSRALGAIERLHERLLAGGGFKIQTLLGCIVRFEREEIIVAREPGRSVLPEVLLLPNAELLWDDRFLITNNSAAIDLSVGASEFIQRRQLETLLGFKVTAPMEAIKTAPVVVDASETVLALGGWTFDERVSVRLLTD